MQKQLILIEKILKLHLFCTKKFINYKNSRFKIKALSYIKDNF